MQKKPVHRVWIVLLIVAGAGRLSAGEYYDLGQKVFEADVILELTMPVRVPFQEDWKAKLPHSAGELALQGATITRVLKNIPGDTAIKLPENLHIFSDNSAYWRRGLQRGQLRALIFLRREGSGYGQIVGVESETGQYADVNPRYENMVSAITEAVTWPEERMRAVGTEMLWARQRTILSAEKNPYLISLALSFLKSHQAAKVIDETWGAGRKSREARIAKTVNTRIK